MSSKPKLSSEEVNHWLLEYIHKKSGLKLKSIKILDSKRPFGMMSGYPEFKTMFLSRAVVGKFNDDELRYVVLHEAGHSVLYHSFKKTVWYLLLAIMASGIVYLFNEAWWAAVIVGMVGGLVLIQIGRRYEYEADRYALKKLDDPQGMIGATRKFQAYYNKSSRIFNFLSSGVPYEERIKMAEQSRKVGG